MTHATGLLAWVKLITCNVEPYALAVAVLMFLEFPVMESM